MKLPLRAYALTALLVLPQGACAPAARAPVPVASGPSDAAACEVVAESLAARPSLGAVQPKKGERVDVSKVPLAKVQLALRTAERQMRRERRELAAVTFHDPAGKDALAKHVEATGAAADMLLTGSRQLDVAGERARDVTERFATAMNELSTGCLGNPRRDAKECEAIGSALNGPSATLGERLGTLRLTGRRAEARARLVKALAEVRDAATFTEGLSVDEAKWRATLERYEATGKRLEGRCDGVSPLSAPSRGWVGAAGPNLRELTVIVKVRPPSGLAAAFGTLAQQPGAAGEVFGRVAAGKFGTGTVVVVRDGARTRPLVLTNRHVVELGDDPVIETNAGRTIPGGRVIFTDADYDLAVVELPASAGFDRGFPLAVDPGRDQQTVIATGYPALGGRPSYQTTRGQISNERLVVEGLTHIQHTAPIDPGNSGGPLTSESGGLVGINTFVAHGRENVGIAVPAAAAANAVRLALGRRSGATPGGRGDAARDACLRLVSALASEPRDFASGARLLADSLTARDGLSALRAMRQTFSALDARFAQDPSGTLRLAVLVRMMMKLGAHGGLNHFEGCTDLSQAPDGDHVAVTLHAADGERVQAVFGVENGAMKVVEFDDAAEE